jgi:hypothetical protein
MARLDLYREGRWISSLELGERTYLVGREPNCDLVLVDALVSRRHFQLSWVAQESEYQLQDLDTPNGTQINGVREFSRRLRLPATLQIGGEMILFDPDASGDAPPDDDELPAWALEMLGDDDESIPSTAHIAPAELARMQAKVRNRARPHLLVKTADGQTADVFPLDTKVTPIGFGSVRLSLGSSPRGRDQVVAEATRLEDDRVRIKAKGLFGKIEAGGKARREVVLKPGDAATVAGVVLEYHSGLEGQTGD